jgi:GNAT superfamily N-acetyltransferase
MDQSFTGEVIEWRGPAPYYFVPVPEEDGEALRAVALSASYGWGMLPIRARIGTTEWKTSLWPKDGSYLLPLKDAVRKPRGLDAGDTVEVQLTFDPQSRQPKQAREPASDREAPTRAAGGEAARLASGGGTPTRARVPRSAGSREPISPGQLTIVPANQATAEDLRAVFGERGDTARCWCQRFRMLPKESWASEGPEELAARLRDQTACGNPKAEATTGLIAYLDGEPVGWCAVAPRADHPRLLRDFRVPWQDRAEDKTDPTVWAVTCFVTRVGYRRRGISRALARAAADFARDRGARAVEGYPDLVDGGYVGTLATFADAGYAEASRPGRRRAVMRIDF